MRGSPPSGPSPTCALPAGLLGVSGQLSGTLGSNLKTRSVPRSQYVGYCVCNGNVAVESGLVRSRDSEMPDGALCRAYHGGLGHCSAKKAG